MGCGAQSAYKDGESIVSVPQYSNRFLKKQLIGQGSYGQVYKCMDPITKTAFAMKVIKMNAKTKQQAILEISQLKIQIAMLKRLNHPNIVKYQSFDVTPSLDEVQIVMELVIPGSLKQYLQKNGPLSQKVCSQVGAKILKSLIYLHDQCIIHRDLKCANILINQNMEPKISDFGTAKVVINKDQDDIAKLSASLKGTPYYMAPEVLKRIGHNQSADIWSFGCMMIEMLTGKAPWSNALKLSQIIGYITSGVHPPFPPNLSKQCVFFLQSCFDPVPSNRLTALELLKHRFIDKNGILNYNFSKGNHTKNKVGNSTVNQDENQKFLGNEQMNEKVQNQVTYHQRPQPGNRIKTQPAIDNKVFKYPKKQNQKVTRRKTEKQTVHSRINVDFQQNEPNDVSISDQQELPKDKQLIKRTLENLKNKKYGKDLSRNLTTAKYHSVHQISDMSFSSSFDDQYRSNTQISKEEYAINTMISRAERNNLEEQQKFNQRLRQEEKKKWEKELKEGAQMLKKELGNRYYYTTGV